MVGGRLRCEVVSENFIIWVTLRMENILFTDVAHVRKGEGLTKF